MPGEAAFERALEALSHKERTSAELGDWLPGRGFEAGEIEEAIERLTVAGRTRRRALRRSLRGRQARAARLGAGADPASRSRRARAGALADRRPRWTGDGRADQLERAIELLERRAERPVDERSRGRALAYLARRGYDSELAYEAVRAFEGGRPEQRVATGTAEAPGLGRRRGTRRAQLARSAVRVYDRCCGLRSPRTREACWTLKSFSAMTIDI